MSDQLTTPMSNSDLVPTGKPSVIRILRDQRKAALVALIMMVASFWVLGQLDRWLLAGCISGGVLLGLVNHVATEYWLFKTIAADAKPTKNQMIASTITRLALLTVVAVGAAVAFWPDGIGLLLGLAVFRLIALVMTSVPLLKELREQ